ncbi:MAG: M56 family metallopeptidase, partial [Chitinophagaceae bacterium]
MDQFSHNFLATLLHSLWQSSLLLGFYSIVVLIKPRLTPLSKRNILFTLLLLQLGYSVVTFYLLSSNGAQGLLLAFSLFSKPLLQESWPQQYSEPIFLLYAVYVCGKVCVNYLSWMRFKTGSKFSLNKTTAELRLFTLTQSLAFGIKRKVAVWHSNSISTPMTFGFWKPVILLPVALISQLTPQQLEAIIIHELTHIKYKDYLLNWGLIVVETVFFFNPFVRYIAKHIKMEREKNCDVQVLHFKYGNIIYAEALLKTSQVQQEVN